MSNERIERLYQTAQSQIGVGQLESAIESLRELLSIDPDDASAHALLGFCLLRLRRAVAAEYEIGLALALEPENAWAHAVMAEVQVARLRLKRAEEHARSAIAFDYAGARAALALAVVLDLQKRADERDAIMRDTLAAYPDDAEVLAAASNYARRSGDAAGAESFARAAMESRPDSPAAARAMAWVLLARRDFEGARELIQWLLTRDPTSERNLNLLAGLKAAQNPLLGLWWRYATWIAQMSEMQVMRWLLGAFLVFRLVLAWSANNDAAQLGRVVTWIWLGLVAYSWVGPAVFQRMIQKELAPVRLNDGF